MKAAVITRFGEVPQYKEFPDPDINSGQSLIKVKAAVLENFDKLTVSGAHYSSKQQYPQFPSVVGTDGVGLTEDNRLVAFGALTPPHGAFAEKVAAGYTIPVPDGITPAKAAAIPPSVLTSLLPLRHSAQLQPGETVLINGATGVSGRIAVQVARLLGAGKIVATGRNTTSLHLLPSLGADEVIPLDQDDTTLAKSLKTAAGDNGYDVVIDFLWGRPTEIVLETFIPEELGFPKHIIRYVQTGEAAGSRISLPASAFRTSGLLLMGIGKISYEILSQELANTWQWLKEDKFYMDIEEVPLKDISSAWQRNDLAGKRLVLVP